MADYTAHYHLLMLESGDSFNFNDYEYSHADRQHMDYLLYQGAEGHKHDGAAAVTVDPSSGLGLVLVPGEGALPAGQTIRYKYTLVDVFGAESAGSIESTISTPQPVTAPNAPTFSILNTGGTLLPGNYYYILTAYTTANTLETTGSPRIYGTLSQSSNTNKVTLTFPSKPLGALGYNIYRRSPGSQRFQYLSSVNLNVATPPTTFVDDGSFTEDCNRTVPLVNTTANGCAVQVTFPGATPAVTAGYTWRLYRTYTLGNYSSSLLHWVVEETSEHSGIITPTYLDVGVGTTNGQPPAFSQIVGSPSKIDPLTEISGVFPTGIQPHSEEVILEIPGALPAGSSTVPVEQWICPFDNAVIIQAIAYFKPWAKPASQDAELEIGRAQDGSDGAFGIDVLTGQNSSGVIDLGSFWPSTPEYTLQKGDPLYLFVTQNGGGATPTDYGLKVSLKIMVLDGSKTDQFNDPFFV